MPSAIIAATLYLIVTVLQARRLKLVQPIGKLAQAPSNRGLIALGVVAVLAHGYSAFGAIQSPEGVNLGFFKVSSLIFWMINLFFILSLLRRPLANLGLILFPLSAIAVLTSVLAPGNAEPFNNFSGGMLFHIGSSVLAYAVLTIAACQAAAVAALDYQLRHRHTRGLVQVLPPLQLMETMLFELLWVGLILLTIAIGSGMLFLEDIFAQHLVHKTVLTMSAWLLFATLLWGRHQLGWRSQTAVRFTLSGFVVLMLGYFGSKFVLELILHQV
jgi:ABC-type uncharacterized transport system permease subunit